MIKFLVMILLWASATANACSGYVIAFKGKDDVFDGVALADYAKHVGYCSRVYSWNQVHQAIKQIHSTTKPYQLYGYSKGAESVAKILKRTDIRRPEYAITIGAYRTTNVDFSQYDIRYDNYFDDSGRGQRSPGIFLTAAHDRIQREVNRIKFQDQ